MAAASFEEPSGQSGDGEVARGRRPTARRELVGGEIDDHAARLFAERGFAGTSLQDIAEAVGVTRQALYYYVKSKDEILGRLVSEMTDRLVDRMQAIHDDPSLDPPNALHRIAYLTATDRAVNRTRFQLLDRSASALPEHLAESYLSGRRRALAVLRAVVEEGIDAGVFRPVDSRVAALSVLGMCNWVAWWFEPAPDHPVEPVATQIAEGAVAMLRAPDSGADPLSALAAARIHLDQLERHLTGRSPTS